MLRTIGAAVGALIAILFLAGVAAHLPHVQDSAATDAVSRTAAR